MSGPNSKQGVIALVCLICVGIWKEQNENLRCGLNGGRQARHLAQKQTYFSRHTRMKTNSESFCLVSSAVRSGYR